MALRSFAKFKIVLLPIISLAFCLILSGCDLVTTTQQSSISGPLGIFKSTDSGAIWASKVSFLNTQGQSLTIGDANVNKIIADPSDEKALYVATVAGLFYSYTGAESWQQVEVFGANKINDIAIDYFDKCDVFVAVGQSIYRSTDCLRTWREIYVDTRTDLQITQIVADHYNRTYVYAANNQGEVLKSLDFGKTWQTIKRTDNPIHQLLIDENDSRIVYVTTENTGIFKTTDGGKTWSDEKTETDINKALDEFPESKTAPFLVQDSTRENSFIASSKYGLLRTTDGGETWEAIPLITPERSAVIYALAVDPSNAKNIFYSTENTIYKTTDGGKSWATQKSPSSGIPNFIFIDPKNPNIIYLGAKAISQ